MDDNNTFYYVNWILAKTKTVKENPDILKYKVWPSEKGKSASQLLHQALQKVRKREERTVGWNHIFIYIHGSLYTETKAQFVNTHHNTTSFSQLTSSMQVTFSLFFFVGERRSEGLWMRACTAEIRPLLCEGKTQ